MDFLVFISLNAMWGKWKLNTLPVFELMNFSPNSVALTFIIDLIIIGVYNPAASVFGCTLREHAIKIMERNFVSNSLGHTFWMFNCPIDQKSSSNIEHYPTFYFILFSSLSNWQFSLNSIFFSRLFVVRNLSGRHWTKM